KLQWVILSSIRNLEFRINVWIDGATLALVYRDGFLLPAGMSAPRLGSGTDKDIDNDASFRLVDYINRQPHLELTNSRINVEGLWPEKTGFNDVNILMVNRLGYREIDARFNLSGPSESTVQMYGRVKGSMVNLKTLQGDYYLDVENAPIVPWLPEGMRHFEHLELESAFGGVELWGRVKHGVVHRVTANVELDNVVVNNTKELRQATLRKAEGVLQYRYLAEGEAQVVLNDFHMEHELFVWDPALLSLNIRRSGGSSNNPKQWAFDLLLDEINVEPWVQYYIDFTNAESPGRGVLTHTSPQGLLQDVHLRATLREGQLDNLYASAELSDFTMLPYKFIPGVQNLHADLVLNESLGFVSLHSDNLLLDYPALMRETLQFDWFDAQVQMKLLDDSVVMETGLIALNNQEARTATQVSMTFPRDTSLSPRIRALSTLRGIDVSLTPKYLPAGILQEGLITFLDDSVIGGDLLRGDILFNGPLNWHMQEEDLNMQLGYMVDDTEFRFLPDWKPVTDVQVDVIVDRTFVDAYIIEGAYYGVSIDQFIASTRRESKDDPFLLVANGLLNGTVPQGVNLLQESPLHSKIGGWVDDIALDGGMALDLNLSLLLAKDNVDLALDLGVGIKQGMLSMPKQKLTIDEINGDFTFDLINGIRSEQMFARVFGGDVSASIYPVFKVEAVEGSDEKLDAPARELLSTQINVTGEADLPLVADWLTFPALNYLSGDVSYNAILNLPKNKATSPDISVRSSLKGVAVEWPKPFYKERDAERDLYIYTTLEAGQREEGVGGSRLFSLRYGEVVDLVSEIESSRLKKAAIVFGGVGRGKATLPEVDGYRVGGFLSELNVKAWADMFNVSSPDKVEGAHEVDGRTLTESIRVPMLIGETLLDGNLKVDSLSVFGQRFPETYFHFKPSDVAWNVDVNGQGVDAKFSLPKYLLKTNQKLNQQELPIIASFSQLQLSKPGEAQRKKSKELVSSLGLDPSMLPPLELKIDNLLLNDEPFGRWDMQLKPVPEGVLIEPLVVRLKATDFSGKGLWLSKRNGSNETSVQGVVKARDVADVLKGWGRQPSLDSKEAKGTLQASWPGAPFEFDVLEADAAVSMKIKDGHFLNVNSGAVDKVWGALNFQTLLKRLRLNFSDLSSDDLTFEEIDADLRLRNKVLTVDKMEIDSPAVGIELKGDVLLAEERLALKLDVAIPVTRNLVLPAAAVGGLPAAATAYVIERVLGKQLDKLTTVKYIVGGTFDNPDIKVKDSFSVIPKPLRESILSTCLLYTSDAAD
ncbi:MAG: hypothetical protein KUG73_11375, partial [Pseudomonadales bacterium]|nr:hypothetical protein [Pseudomonadales bacterium]